MSPFSGTTKQIDQRGTEIQKKRANRNRLEGSVDFSVPQSLCGSRRSAPPPTRQSESGNHPIRSFWILSLSRRASLHQAQSVRSVWRTESVQRVCAIVVIRAIESSFGHFIEATAQTHFKFTRKWCYPGSLTKRRCVDVGTLHLHCPTPGKNLMSMVSEFKDFVMRGNVVDMAVGVVMELLLERSFHRWSRM